MPRFGIAENNYDLAIKSGGNFIYGTGESGVELHGGINNKVTNNVILNARQWSVETLGIDKPMTGTDISGNFLDVSTSTESPVAIDISATDPTASHNNVILNPTGKALLGAPSTCLAEVAAGRDRDGVLVVPPHGRRRCSTAGITARWAAPQIAGFSVIMTRGARNCRFISLQSRRLAARVSSRLWKRVSSAIPFRPTARHCQRVLSTTITQNWRGKPLPTHQVIVQLIASTATRTGLTAQCRVDENAYGTGAKASDAETASLGITPADLHGEWIYSIAPRRPDH